MKFFLLFNKTVSYILIILLFIYCNQERKENEQNSGIRKNLQYGIPHDPFSLDPAESSDLIYDQIVFNIFETLLLYNWDTGQYIPVLANSWEKTADNLVWIFHLRSGVTFHDGSFLNAHAVKISFDRQFNKNCPFYKEYSTDNYGKFAFDMIENIAIIDDMKVRFKLKFPCSYFLDNIASPYFSSVVSISALKKYKDQFGSNPIGTGPFKFSVWQKGEKITLHKFTNYWKNSSYIDSVSYKVIPDLAERIKLIKNEELDVITGLSASVTNELYYNPNLIIFTPQISGTTFLGFNCQKKPFDDLRIRKAIAYAINVKSMIASLSRGFAAVAQGPLPQNILSYDPSIKQEGYNIKKSNKLIEEAGYSNGFSARLCYLIETDTLRANPLSQYIKTQLEKIGIQTKIAPYNNLSLYEKEVFVQEKTDMFLGGWPTYTKDADNFLYSLFHSQSKYNFFHYSNPEVDHLLDQARKMMAYQKRREIYKKIQQIIIDETPAVFLSHPTMGYAISKRVKNFKTYQGMIVQLADVKLTH